MEQIILQLQLKIKVFKLITQLNNLIKHKFPTKLTTINNPAIVIKRITVQINKIHKIIVKYQQIQPK